MKLYKYIVDIILVAIVVVLLVQFFKSRSGVQLPSNESNDFSEPKVQETGVKKTFGIKLEFSNSSVFNEIVLSGKVTTQKGEVDLGDFTVRDIRLWRVDGERIIDDKFSFESKPLYIIVNQKNELQENVIFEGEISENTELQSKFSDIKSTLKISISSD